MKTWLSYILMAVLGCAFATSCITDDDVEGMCKEGSYVSLSRVVIPSDDEKNEQITVVSVRVLIFDGTSQNIISNKLISGDNITGTYNTDYEAYIIKLNQTAIEAYAGNHYVYAVLNENAFGANLGLDAVTTMSGLNGIITNTTVAYNTIVAVPEGEEPPFLMYTYDRVNIPSGRTAANPFVIDMTGLDAGDYAFSMRRSMAKVVLESVIGGKTPDGTVLATDKLIETSAIHILDMELVNVPNRITWSDDESYTKTPYTGGYLYPASGTEGFDLGVSTNGSNTARGYYEREWLGSIKVSGTLGFTRTDELGNVWKLSSGGQGVNAYTITPSYVWNETDAKDPKNHELNAGNFAAFFVTTLDDPNNFIPGPLVPGEWVPTAININPAVWNLTGLDNTAYYIPENITENNQTAIRITASIATPIAELSEEEVNKILQEMDDKNFDGGFVGDSDGDGVMDYLDLHEDKQLWLKVLFDTAVPTQNPNGTNTWGILYSGIKYYFNGTAMVEGKDGYWAKITENEVPEKVVTITIPLNNNDGNGGGLTDHNIYRGHEYRVKLYVNKTNDAWSKSAGAATRTIQVGDEELTITGKVVATPMK